MFTASTAPDRWTLSGAYSEQFQFPAGSGNWYQLDYAILPPSGGTWSGSAPAQSLAGAFFLQTRLFQLQQAGGPPSCTKNNLRCIYTAAFALAATSTYQATTGAPGLPTTTTGDAAVIDATTSSPIVASMCSPPWNAFSGTPATYAGLRLEVQ